MNDVTDLTAADRLEIREVLATWNHAEDDGQAEVWADLFTADGTFRDGAGHQIAGRDALLQSARARAADPDMRTRSHWMSEPTVTPCSGGVEVRHYGMVVGLIDGLPRPRHLSERSYFMRKENGRWRIAARTIKNLPQPTEP